MTGMKTILAVEDDRSLLGIYMRMLAAPGRSLSQAGSVAEAEALLDSNSYDLLITDLKLPDGLGTRLIDALEAKGAETKSLLISGGVTQEIRGLTGKGHCIGCLDKPVDFQRLLSAVSRALEN